MALHLIDDHKAKGVCNEMIIVMLADLFRQRTLDGFMDEEVLASMRAVMKFFKMHTMVTDYGLKMVRDTLVQAQQIAAD